MWAATGAGPAPVAPARADAIYELDARVASRPLPDCRPRALSSRVLLDRGAHPRLPPEGTPLWFDARAPDGRRQVHRLDRATGTVVCWTCDEAGNNERPSPGAGGYAVVFETDRYTSWREPRNREIQLKSASGEAPSKPSIRLTIDPAADRWPVLGPGGQLLLWSRDADGRSEVAGAVIRRGHGGILLGTPSLVARGGLAAALPLAWSDDARTIVIARGNPLGTLEAVRLDPATGAETTLGGDAVAAPAGTSADGGWLALSTSQPVGVLAHLPSWLGFLTAAASTVFGSAAPSLAETGVRSGEPTAPGTPLDLGEVRGWGAPTGVALDPGRDVPGARSTKGGPGRCRGASRRDHARLRREGDVVIDLPRIRKALASYEPQLLAEAGRKQAAVAVVLRQQTPSPELLLIERARRAGDPWSGHMAFPGGRVERADTSVRSAAERETFEEVGIDLGDAELLGRLDDLEGRHSGRKLPLVISAFVYHAPDPGPVEPSPEVEEALWVPVPLLADPERHVDYAYPLAGGSRYPGILVGHPDRHVVWGLTYRFLEIFFRIVERPLPDRWQAFRAETS